MREGVERDGFLFFQLSRNEIFSYSSLFGLCTWPLLSAKKNSYVFFVHFCFFLIIRVCCQFFAVGTVLS